VIISPAAVLRREANRIASARQGSQRHRRTRGAGSLLGGRIRTRGPVL